MVNWKVFMRFLNIILLILVFSTCKAAENESQYRILELIPDLVTPLAVEPAIPDDFVSIPKNKQAGICDWVYLGKKEVIERFLEDGTVLEPFIKVRLSDAVVQTGPSSFSCDKFNIPSIVQNTKWGNFPVASWRHLLAEKVVYRAYVGLNAPGGHTLTFTLALPNDAESTDISRDHALWENFINNTKPLPEYDFYKINGFDLQEGHTIVTLSKQKIKVSAEEDKNGTIQIAIQPLTKHITYKKHSVQQTRKGGEWKYASPMLRLPMDLKVVNGNSTIIDNVVVSVLIKKVDSFTTPTSQLLADQIDVSEIKSEHSSNVNGY